MFRTSGERRHVPTLGEERRQALFDRLAQRYPQAAKPSGAVPAPAAAVPQTPSLSAAQPLPSSSSFFGGTNDDWRGSSFMYSVNRPTPKRMSREELEEAFDRLQTENIGHVKPETLEEARRPLAPVHRIESVSATIERLYNEELQVRGSLQRDNVQRALRNIESMQLGPGGRANNAREEYIFHRPRTAGAG